LNGKKITQCTSSQKNGVSAAWRGAIIGDITRFTEVPITLMKRAGSSRSLLLAHAPPAGTSRQKITWKELAQAFLGI
jgi:hypothetical protein